MAPLSRVARNLIVIVWSQLPKGLHDKLAVDVETDPHGLRAVAVFVETAGLRRTWRVPLVTTLVDGVEIRAKVPDAMLAELCAVV